MAHHFSILSIDLPAVHEVLPDDVRGRSDRRNGIEERLSHPNRQNRIFLSQRLTSGGRVAVSASERASNLELQQADDQSDECQRKFGSERCAVQVDDESRRSADNHEQRHKPQIKRNLAVFGNPLGALGEQKPATLRDGKWHDKQRSHASQNLRKRADSVAHESQDDRCQ